jgi:purine-nucleoside phosphorylase
METQVLVDKINEATAYLKGIIGNDKYEIGIVMGTGLEAMASKIDIEHSIPYQNIPGFPVATVSFHKGNLLIGTIAGKKILAMQGRLHYYEGYSSTQITFPLRVMHQLGIQYLLVSNAAGGLHKNFKKGNLVAITDHINLLPDNPLRGLNHPTLGERFVDMSMPYNETLIEKLKKFAKNDGITLHSGVYAAVQGPNLETRAEYRWLHSLPADLVGMSTVPEIIVANQLQIKCAAISVVTDECDPDNLKPINIAEIIAVAAEADEKLTNLYLLLIKDL